MPLTRAHLSLVYPEPYVNGGGDARIYSGILEAGSNEIDLAKDGGYNSSESILLFLSGVLQKDFSFNPDYSKIIIPETLSEDIEYQVIIGTLLGHVNQNYMNVIENSEATNTAIKSIRNSLSTEMSTFKASVQEELDGNNTITYLVTTPSVSIDRIAKGFNKTFSVSADSLSNPALEIDRFVLSIQELNITEKVYYGTDNSASITISIPQKIEYDTLNLAVYAIDVENNRSKTYTKVIPIIDGYVEQPEVLYPTEGVYLSFGKGITIQSTNFSCTADDTHKHSSWKITDDKNGKHILACEMESSDKTSHLFESYTLDNLAGNKTYYAHVLHTGNLTGPSVWSQPRKFYTRNGVSTKNGRFIYRHESDKGIVIEWMLDNELKKLFVYDELVTGLPMLTTDTNTRYTQVEAENTVARAGYNGFYNFTRNVINNGNVIYGVGQENAIPGITTNLELQNNGADVNLYNPSSSNQVSPNNHAYDSSRLLCNFWMTLNESNNPALVNYARSITNIEGIDNLDIPSIREMQVILTEFNNTNPILSKDKKSSFFANKKFDKFMTSNTFYHQESFNSSLNFSCTNETFKFNSSTESYIINYENNHHSTYASDLHSQDEDIYTNSDAYSFLVRDITDF